MRSILTLCFQVAVAHYSIAQRPLFECTYRQEGLRIASSRYTFTKLHPDDRFGTFTQQALADDGGHVYGGGIFLQDDKRVRLIYSVPLSKPLVTYDYDEGYKEHGDSVYIYVWGYPKDVFRISTERFLTYQNSDRKEVRVQGSWKYPVPREMAFNRPLKLYSYESWNEGDTTLMGTTVLSDKSVKSVDWSFSVGGRSRYFERKEEILIRTKKGLRGKAVWISGDADFVPTVQSQRLYN